MTNWILALALAFVVSVQGVPTAQPSGKEVAALVSALSGSATVNQPRGTSLSLFDWVRAGATVEVPRGSKLTLVLPNGHRFELEGPARATVTAAALSAPSGSVRTLSAIPPLPRVMPIADRRQAGRDPAAVRVRGPLITSLYPSGGAVTRGGSTAFTFGAVKGAAHYALELEDASGTRIFQIQTEKTQVALPTVLKPGASYYWRVRTIDSVGAQAHGEAAFTTLAAEDEQAREALRKVVGTSGDSHGLGLLAHVDYALGLFREARDGVEAALAKSPADPRLRAALAQLAERLAVVGVQGGVTP